MSLISDFEERTAWKHERIGGWFSAHPNAQEKVAANGSYRTFPGTTVVFQCSPRMAGTLCPLQEDLHRQMEETEMLSQPLPAATFHMTLHDLVSPEQKNSLSLRDYFAEMDDSLNRAVKIVRELKQQYAGKQISLIPDHVVNMVSRSVVLMLKPAAEEDFALLLEMYHRFDEVVRLPYPLTPHITLAYFKPGMIDGDRLGTVVSGMNEKLGSLPAFTFPAESLTAQKFMDMRNYISIE